jgi:hypothetical protein
MLPRGFLLFSYIRLTANELQLFWLEGRGGRKATPGQNKTSCDHVATRFRNDYIVGYAMKKSRIKVES